MEKKEEKQYKFGLVGKDISYSFSRGYFSDKFKNMGLHNYSYVNFDLENIEEFPEIIQKSEVINGFNVTIPYKEAVMPFLQSLDTDAKKIGAVNTIKITEQGLKGYNTDTYGFKHTILPHLKEHHKKALILGTGGASKAVAFVFKELGIEFTFVSRNSGANKLSYQELTKTVLEDYTVIVNCTPLGTHPNILEKPAIPYNHITKKHLLFDLIYNPEKTAFLRAGEAQGAAICNGQKMLELQAEKSWEIWNS
ncbi:shikimate dehydrogenase [Maribacter vaceletii]|uniref:Shikimate dehydrogenase n=1 Tax=Maribacter vaceletii TaxID=1206816 RepID=A0A495DSX1_9FLAO|nr:shikimate dehydrogenase [Maribacter vaceletii]RKR07087.1 shikimate dehydrogenase [Maribacter vaceletii]